MTATVLELWRHSQSRLHERCCPRHGHRLAQHRHRLGTLTENWLSIVWIITACQTEQATRLSPLKYTFQFEGAKTEHEHHINIFNKHLLTNNQFLCEESEKKQQTNELLRETGVMLQYSREIYLWTSRVMTEGISVNRAPS